jgi:hypothetical protein
MAAMNSYIKEVLVLLGRLLHLQGQVFSLLESGMGDHIPVSITEV